MEKGPIIERFRLDIAKILAEKIEQIEECLRELPIDYTDRKAGFESFLSDLLEGEL